MWEIPYKNGKKEGIVKHYSESGEIESRVTYKDGKKGMQLGI
jgi:antitoxin component YwqK of YwqJK toxin-antitoxin module